MSKCTKCNREIADNDLVYLKCQECGKTFSVSLSELKNLQKQNVARSGQSLLKCPECGNEVDDGSETMSYKCSGCGNVMGGNLEYFVTGDTGAEENICDDKPARTGNKFCSNCGSKIENGVNFCPNCGADIKKSTNERRIEEEGIRKRSLNLKNKKVVIPACLIIAFIVCGITFYKFSHIEVMHGITWGMNVSQVKEQEESYSNVVGEYNEEHNYLGVSNVDFFGEDADVLYIFEEDELASIWVTPLYNTYENTYNIALQICKDYNLPVSFDDETEEEYIRRSTLTWNIKGTTIELIGNYMDVYSPSYYFSLKPYNGSEYGDKYEDRGICFVGSAGLFPCKNEVTPWSKINDSGGYCYEHECYVIGCPNGSANVKEKMCLCREHEIILEEDNY